ncbi:hypothetical protein [Rhizobium rhizogenes]|uniref:hypothetical protein n=1 Tax=Rhizobium rhizogenes TaxID=359 RepID=UPI0022C69676|nr:hypothetical protein [Rhizobium rhizogenes]MCZ7480559.1 hypothetical protein [Rhizobium rhizogenes]
MSGGGKQQTTTQTSAPWSGAQPALNKAIEGAQNLYNSGTGAQVYTGSTVVPWSSETQQAMGNIQNNANANTGGSGLSGQYQGVINNGGYNDAQQGALRNTQSLANSTYSISPELQKVLDAQAAKVSDTVNLNASAAGRYGSGSNQSLLAKNVGDLANSTIYNDFNNWQGRRDAANTSLFNMGQQGFNNLGAAYTGMNAPNQDLMNIGAMNEDLATRQKNDELRIFNEQQNKPWENLSRLNAIASGAGSMGGTTTTSQPGQNPFLTAAGYGLSGLGLLGGLF